MNWISVKDGLPERGKLPDGRVSRQSDEVNIFAGKNLYLLGCYDFDCKEWYIQGGGYTNKGILILWREDDVTITHWCELEPPAREERS